MTRMALLMVTLMASSAGAEAPEPIPDVRVDAQAPPWQRLAIGLDPLAFITDLGKLAADLVLVPVDHHAIVVSPFYASSSTAPIVVQAADGKPMYQLPEQIFRGAGLELGYRYYRGLRGPRGWFVGPSLIFMAMFEHQGQYGDGSHTRFQDVGVAIDAGYQALIADKVSLVLGGGVQGLVTSRPIPGQQFPAKLYANSGVSPRVVFSIGWAL